MMFYAAAFFARCCLTPLRFADYCLRVITRYAMPLRHWLRCHLRRFRRLIRWSRHAAAYVTYDVFADDAAMLRYTARAGGDKRCAKMADSALFFAAIEIR